MAGMDHKRRRGTQASWMRQQARQAETPEEIARRDRACRSKKVYTTKKQAKEFIRDRGMRGKQRAYRCEFCGGFHTTSQMS